MYYAHSENNNGERHLLKQHLESVVKKTITETCIGSFELLVHFAGLFHDAGKYQQAFQDYLFNGGIRGSVPHAVFGAILSQSVSKWILPFCIEGHHKGLSDRSRLKNTLAEFKEYKEFREVEDKFYKEFERERFVVEDNLDNQIYKKYNSFESEFLVRYLFSLLTDADWLDTEKHFNQTASDLRESKELEIEFMIDKIERKFDTFSKTGEINQLRNRVRHDAIQKAEFPIGFFSLTLPTGLGKTLTSFYWALLHARKHQLKRIIIVLPYINIIDQTVKILKNIFGDDAVLEHHSGVIESDIKNDDKKFNPKKLASQNWDYPVIVTTTVQFFESLFSNKPSQCRKIHNIARSVVVFDEVQSLPKSLVQPTLTMLKNIQAVLKTTFLFCTATQPAFIKREKFDGIEAIEPLVKNAEVLFEKTKRVEYNLINKLKPIDENLFFEKILLENNSVLVVLNTKKQALMGFAAVYRARQFDKVYHLSTSMCAQHRKYIIARIRRDLNQSKKIAVFSTQLIEAGVDFDFPVVYRALAPLESIIQAAGRCNREGKLRCGKVNIFELEESTWPPGDSYKTCAYYVKNMLQEDVNILHSHNVFEKYYRQVIALFVNADQFHINDDRTKFNFEKVAQNYKLIRQPTDSVFIFNYNQKSENLYNQLKGKPIINREDIKLIQPYLVQIYPNQLEKFGGQIDTLDNGLKIWFGKYDTDMGLVGELLEVDNFIV